MHSRSSPNAPENALAREQAIAVQYAAVFIVTTISGVSTHLFGNSEGTWVYWSYLAHAFLGVAMIPIAIGYALRHIRRTLGVRRPMSIISGYIQALILIGLSLTGLYILVVGLSERFGWVLDIHIVLAYLVLAILAIHVATALFRHLEKTTKPVARLILTAHTLRTTGIALALYSLAVGLATFVYDQTREEWASAPAVTPYQYNYGDTPFLPSQTQTDNGGFVASRLIANSRQCGSCHAEIFQEWLESAHSQAGSDPSYVKNVNLLEKSRGTAATRYCEGCHAPVALLTGQLTEGGKHGGTPGTDAFNEGVGCMGCHGISGFTHLKGVASYRFSPSDSYLFEHSDNPVARTIHNFLIRLHPAQHREAMNLDPIFEPEVCATCHEAFMDKDMNQWGWLKMQNDYSSWVTSPFSGRSEHHFSSEQTARCQDCHFPLVTGNDPSANADGLVRSHRTPGANTVLPWLNKEQTQLEAVKKFLQSQKVLINIEEPSRRQATQTLRVVDEQLRPTQNDAPHYFYLGESAQLQVAVSNAMVGHAFPGGTTDINEVWIYLRVSDSNNRVIFESGALDAEQKVDPNAHFYRSLPVDKEGRHVWRHDLFRMIGDTHKNTISPGKSDVVTYRFEVPFWAKGHLSATAVLRYRKFNFRYAEWVLGDAARSLPIVDMARDSLRIPLHKRPPAQEALVFNRTEESIGLD